MRLFSCLPRVKGAGCESVQASAQEALDDRLFGLLFIQTEAHQLGKLLARNFADCRLVNKFGVDVVRRKRGNGGNRSPVHDDRVALGVPAARGVAVDKGNEFLYGSFRRNLTGHHVRCRPRPV